MSIKINKNGKEYDLGFVPQSLYDDVEDLKDAIAEPAFTEAETRANINSGESLFTILGKIKKFFADLKAVAFSGAYSDLSGTPTLATVATSGKYSDLSGRPNLATVATSGSYNDLNNKPTIPTVNNGTLTIQKNGTNVTTFSANQSGNATANITTPVVYQLSATSMRYVSASKLSKTINCVCPKTAFCLISPNSYAQVFTSFRTAITPVVSGNNYTGFVIEAEPTGGGEFGSGSVIAFNYLIMTP